MKSDNPAIANFDVYGLGNKLSSLQIVGQYEGVELFNGYNFTGKSYIFRNPTRITNLSDYGINDSVKSARILNIGSSPGVTLFQDRNQTGKCQHFLTGSYPNLNDQPIGNDTTSSILLYPKTVIEIFKDTNYYNRIEVYRNDYPYVQFINVVFNDAASSIIVGAIV